MLIPESPNVDSSRNELLVLKS